MNVRIGRCRVSISFYFFAITAILCIWGGSDILAGILAAAVHETGHLAMIIFLCRRYPDSVDIAPFGLCISYSLGELEKGHTAVSVAGAAANGFIACVVGILYYFVPSSGLLIFFGANVCLGLINLFPVDPLDGGVFLRLLLEKYISPDRAENISLAVSVIFLIPLVGAGLFILMQSKGNFSLLALALWLMIFIIRKYV